MNSVQKLPERRPLIQLVGGSLAENAVDCERILSQELYVRASRPVRIGIARELSDINSAKIQRDAAQAVVIEVGAEYIRRRLTECAEFQRPMKPKGWRSIDCPKDLASNIVGYGDWPHFRKLVAIAGAPFFREDFSICETPGYDDASGIYYRPIKDFAPIPENPTRDDALAALQILTEPFAEFPFATDIAKSAFICHILTAVTRPALDVTPVFVYSAAKAGTGKTKLMRMASRIVHGCELAMRPHTDQEDEMRKVLYASLLQGDPSIYFDNVVSGAKIRSPVLAGFVTALVYNDRILGKTESKNVVNRALVCLTGNNITTAGDIARRSVTCRLVLDAERTDGRTFKIPNLDGYVLQHRAELLCAALTIMRAYIVAGQPVQAKALASFERWSVLARDPLLWLGMQDPVASQETETEDELGPLRDAFAAIDDYAIGRDVREFKAKDLAAAIGYGSEPMHEAMEESGCGDAHDVTKVGFWLRDHLDHTAGAYKLVNRGAGSRAKRWRLIKSGGPEK